MCQVAWINNTKALGHFDSLDKRVESFTGWSTSSAERYQIVNYGLGGHFIPHWDAFDRGMVMWYIVFVCYNVKCFKLHVEQIIYFHKMLTFDNFGSESIDRQP